MKGLASTGANAKDGTSPTMKPRKANLDSTWLLRGQSSQLSGTKPSDASKSPRPVMRLGAMKPKPEAHAPGELSCSDSDEDTEAVDSGASAQYDVLDAAIAAAVEARALEAEATSQPKRRARRNSFTGSFKFTPGQTAEMEDDTEAVAVTAEAEKSAEKAAAESTEAKPRRRRRSITQLFSGKKEEDKVEEAAMDDAKFAIDSKPQQRQRSLTGQYTPRASKSAAAEKDCMDSGSTLSKSQDVCVKEGTVKLQERSKKKLGMKTWVDRFLRLDTYELSCYEDVEAFQRGEKSSKSWPLPFKITTKANLKLEFALQDEAGMNTKFQAETEASRAQWLRAVRRLSVLLVEKRLAGAAEHVRDEGEGELSRESSGRGVEVVASPDAHIKDRYSVRECIGSGMAGKVYRARDRQSGETVAIKVLEKSKFMRTARARETTEREIDIMTRLSRLNAHHPNIVNLRACVETSSRLYLVMDLARGGELFERIVKRGRFTEFNAAACFKKLAETLQYLHRHGIIHRDLKPENILCRSKEDDSDIVITDFGLSNVVEHSDEMLKSRCGTPIFMAPEMLNRQEYGSLVDVWSAGVVLYTLLSGSYPWTGSSIESFAAKVVNPNALKFPRNPWKTISPEARDLLRKMLKPEPKERISIEEVLKHPWVTMLHKQESVEASTDADSEDGGEEESKATASVDGDVANSADSAAEETTATTPESEPEPEPEPEAESEDNEEYE